MAVLVAIIALGLVLRSLWPDRRYAVPACALQPTIERCERSSYRVVFTCGDVFDPANGVLDIDTDADGVADYRMITNRPRAGVYELGAIPMPIPEDVFLERTTGSPTGERPSLDLSCEPMIPTIRLKPPRPTTLGDFTLEAVSIKVGDDETQLDFRLELSAGLRRCSAVPADRHGQLRLVHLDEAGAQLGKPIAELWTCDLALSFDGELGVLGNGRSLRAIRLALTSQPPTHACEFITRRGDADELVTRFSWRPDDPWHTAEASTRVTMLDALIDRLAAAPDLDLDLGAVIRAFEESGRLFDEDYLDGAQYEVFHQLRTAVGSGSPDRIRAALRRCRSGEPEPSISLRPLLEAGPVVLGHRAVVTSPAFAPDGRRFVAGDEQGALLIHECRGTTWVEAARSKAQAVLGVAWSPDGAHIAVQDRLGLGLRGPGDLAVHTSAPRTGNGPLAFGANGAWVAALGPGGLQLHAVPSLAVRSMELVSNGEALAADPTGQLAVVVDGGATEETAMGAITGREPATIVVFEVEGRKRRTIDPGGPVRGMVHAHGHLVANLFGRGVSIWAASGELVRTFEPYDCAVRALAVTERWLVMIPDRPPREATLDVWSRDTFECRASVAIPGGFAPDWVVASPDGRLLLTRELPVRGEFGIRTWHLDA